MSLTPVGFGRTGATGTDRVPRSRSRRYALGTT